MAFNIFEKKTTKQEPEEDNLVPAIIVTKDTITDGIEYIEASKLPKEAYRQSYGKRYVYPLVETSDGNGNSTYEPWPLLDLNNDDEKMLIPLKLFWALYHPEINTYFMSSDVGGLKTINKWLLVAAMGLLLVFLLMFAFG
jgi:hypothetical protein